MVKFHNRKDWDRCKKAVNNNPRFRGGCHLADTEQHLPRKAEPDATVAVDRDTEVAAEIGPQ